ncbi:hypothetical protein HAX54_050291, partial [Datura stramonium]|nr:hypothetical protein [Datura stramonium]
LSEGATTGEIHDSETPHDEVLPTMAAAHHGDPPLPFRNTLGLGVNFHSKKNRSFRLSAGVIEEVASHHSSDGGVSTHQSYEKPSLIPSRSGPFSLKAVKVPRDRQVSDGPSLRPSF